MKAIESLALVVLAFAVSVSAQDSFRELSNIDADVVELRRVDPATREAPLASIRERLEALDTSGYSREQKVDTLLVWAKWGALSFDQRVMKPWARDPLYFLYQVNRIPYISTPATADDLAELEAGLKDVPEILYRAQQSLTEPVAPLANLAIFHLEQFDGVGQRQPYRDQPPEGTIGWYLDLCGRLATSHPELVSDCEAAQSAVVGYRDWLSARVDQMPASAAIGTEHLNWYLRHVRLLPYDVDDVLLLGRRELHRFRFDYVIDRNKNEHLPALGLTRNADEHEYRTRRAEERIRAIVAEQNLMTIPDNTPESFETDTYWSPRASTYRHFWEELQFRNALNNHIHASIPGHRFDAFLRDRLDNPVRMTFQDTGRAEGWGTYLEEMLVQAGITDDNPRARELFYIALIKRGSRIYAETAMHSGEMSLEQANEYMIDYVPFMEENLGRYDLESYLRRPGSGSMYIIGKIQIERLVSERAHQLGDAFDLGAFHDAFLERGIIPISLIRWEMTGYDDEVRELWEDVVGRPF